jgi:hypothetical protein
MSVPEILKGYNNSSRIFKNAKKYQTIMSKGDDAMGIVSKQMKKDYEMFSKFIESGFGDNFGNELYDIARIGSRADMTGKNVIAKSFNKVTGFNAEMNNAMDNFSRMAMFQHAENSVNFVSKIGAKTPAEAVRLALFDYMDLSPNEQNVIKRVIPFYTFMKKNLAFQMKNITNNPVKYTNLRKFINSTWDAAGIEKEDAKPYERNNMWIPIPGMTKDGKYTVLKTNLPMADFGEFLDNPLKKTVGAISPIAKMPFELATNKQIFSDMPISDFDGQKGNMFKSDFFDGISRKNEYALSQTGLDVPLRTAYAPFAAGAKFFGGDKSFASSAQAVGEGLRLMSEGDVEKNQTARDYEILQRLQDGLKLAKQEMNGDVPTQNELMKRGLDTKDLRKKMEAMLMKFR